MRRYPTSPHRRLRTSTISRLRRTWRGAASRHRAARDYPLREDRPKLEQAILAAEIRVQQTSGDLGASPSGDQRIIHRRMHGASTLTALAVSFPHRRQNPRAEISEALLLRSKKKSAYKRESSHLLHPDVFRPRRSGSRRRRGCTSGNPAQDIARRGGAKCRHPAGNVRQQPYSPRGALARTTRSGEAEWASSARQAKRQEATIVVRPEQRANSSAPVFLETCGRARESIGAEANLRERPLDSDRTRPSAGRGDASLMRIRR